MKLVNIFVVACVITESATAFMSIDVRTNCRVNNIDIHEYTGSRCFASKYDKMMNSVEYVRVPGVPEFEINDDPLLPLVV